MTELQRVVLHAVMGGQTADIHRLAIDSTAISKVRSDEASFIQEVQFLR